MVNDPYRATNLQAPVPPPLVHTPFLWGLRVWWAKSRVHTQTDSVWHLTFTDAKGVRQYYRLPWTGDSIERVALICEGTPPGEPAALPYYSLNPHKELRTPPANVEGVDFLPAELVPTVARLARQVWDTYQRSRTCDPAKTRP